MSEFQELRNGTVLQRAAFWLVFASAVAPLFSIATAQGLLAAALLALLADRERLRFPPLKLPLALFICWTVLAALVSSDVASGWPQVRKFYVYLLVLSTVATAFRSLRDLRLLLFGWAAGASCAALFGLAQFTRTFLAARGSGQSLYHALVGHRITGFMSLWMTFAGQLMIVLMVALAWLLLAPRGRRYGRWLGPAAVLIGLGLVLALTRGQWVGAAAGSVYLMWRWRPKSLFALPLVALAAFLIAPSAVRERAVSIVRPTSELDSNKHRIVVWRTGLEMVKSHPWFGLGPGQVGRQFERYVPADIGRPLPWGWYGHLHNIYLQYAAERGIPALLFLLWLIGKALWDFRRAAAKQPPGTGEARALLEGAAAALLAVLVAGFFEYNLGDSEVLQMFLTVVALGYASGLQQPLACARGSEEPC